MKKLSILLAGAALIAFTGLASAQQTPAVSPSQTQQKPGGADGGLQPDQAKKPGEAGMNQSAPKAATTGSGVKNEPVKGSGQAAPSGGAQGGSAPAPSVKPNEPSRSNP